MREILFRGKPVNKAIYTNFEKKFKNASFFSNGFVFGSLVIYKNKYYICLNIKLNMLGIIFNSNESNMTATMIEVIPETVSQYIGLKDKKRNKIFEDDIIERFWLGKKYIYRIDYDKYIASFIGKDIYGLYFTTFDYDAYEFEIIGNIHDNPELLEVGK